MAGKPLTVAIVGAGISGLASALFLHRRLGFERAAITIYEASPNLTEAGAGIQIPPNASKLLARCGLFPKKEKASASGELQPATVTLRRYENGDILRVSHVGGANLLYNAPYMVIHRADYQKVLYEAVAEAGIKVVFNCTVEKVTDSNSGPSALCLSVAGGSDSVWADLIIGADGIGSAVRQYVQGMRDVELDGPTHYVYRALVSGSAMENADKEVAQLIKNPNSTCWLGPGRHAVAYPIRNALLYNVVLINTLGDGPQIEQHPDRDWDHVVCADSVRQCYANFEPRVRKVLDLARDFRGWTLREGPSPRHWSKNGTVLVGDAAHAMFPYMGQGAAQAIEDAAVLALCVSYGLDRSKPVSECLHAYETLRRPRAERIVAQSRQNGDTWHLVDGECQQKRDAAFSRPQEPHFPVPADPLPPTPPPEAGFADPSFLAWLFGLDAELAAEKGLETIFGESTCANPPKPTRNL